MLWQLLGRTYFNKNLVWVGESIQTHQFYLWLTVLRAIPPQMVALCLRNSRKRKVSVTSAALLALIWSVGLGLKKKFWPLEADHKTLTWEVKPLHITQRAKDMGYQEDPKSLVDLLPFTTSRSYSFAQNLFVHNYPILRQQQNLPA